MMENDMARLSRATGLAKATGLARATGLAGIGAAVSLLLMGPAAAQDAPPGVAPETQFIFNTCRSWCTVSS
jgi:hypothetical protein